MPAAEIHPKKKSEILVLHSVLSIKNVQSNPAAKKPLYKPWFAAIDLVWAKSSFGNFLNTLGPLLVHANISNQRK